MLIWTWHRVLVLARGNHTCSEPVSNTGWRGGDSLARDDSAVTVNLALQGTLTESVGTGPALAPSYWYSLGAMVVLFGLFFAVDVTKDWLALQLGNDPPDAGPLYLAPLRWWTAWILLAPAIAWLVTQLAPDRIGWARSVGAHLAASFGFSSVHLLVVTVVAIWLADALTGPVLASQLRLRFSQFMLFEVLSYWAAVGAAFVAVYYGRYRDRELVAARLAAQAEALERGMAEARLQALQMELNPHFIFNVLNTISGLVRSGESDAAVGMLARLGELLRSSLNEERSPEVSLSRELTLLDPYLDIERTRFRDRLTVDTTVEPNLENALVPTLILQPLVENAVRHGVAKSRGPARISIAAHREGSDLVLRVGDSGNGGGPRAAFREGIGLSNTRTRLGELYGSRGSLDISNHADGGTSVTVRLPLHFEARLSESGVRL